MYALRHPGQLRAGPRKSLVAAIGGCILVVSGAAVVATAHDVDARTALPSSGALPAASASNVGPLSSPALATAPPSGTSAWRLSSTVGPGSIDAYTTVASGPPGTTVGVKVSTTGQHFRLQAFRIGAYRGGVAHLVWRSPVTRGQRQPGPTFAPRRTHTVVAPWRVSLRFDTTGWQPGFYVLKLTTPSGAGTQVPYVVSSTSTQGTVALVVPVATWQAYNDWGGYSLYHGPPGRLPSFAVSFDRPYHDVDGLNDFRTTVIPVVVHAEASGVPLSYLTDIDLQQHPHVLDGARGYVSVSHSEYWTVRMRHEVLRARDRGTNLAFLGANTEYWRIRLSGRATGPDRLETGYHYYAPLDPYLTTHPSLATSRFRDPPDPRPENAMVGMLYECYPADGNYQVVSPHWWGFAGTGVRQGTTFAQLVGPEADRVYPNHHMPRPLQVLSTSSYSCLGTPTTSQSVYYTTPSGAGVFASGTLRWGCALENECDVPLSSATEQFVRRVTDNLLHAFARGPVGLRHPAHGNVQRFHLPVRNDVPAS